MQSSSNHRNSPTQPPNRDSPTQPPDVPNDADVPAIGTEQDDDDDVEENVVHVNEPEQRNNNPDNEKVGNIKISFS